MDNVLVIGAGYMGGGIAQVAAQNGYTVYLQDMNQEALEKTLAQIKWSTERLEEKGKIKDSAKAVQDRVIAVKDLSIAPQCQWIIEAVYEDEKLKKELFKNLDAACPLDTILASNTSTIPITRLASFTQHPERVVGLHFFGPVPLMPTVEVIKGEKTSDAIFNKSADFISSFGYKPLKIMKEVPGFIINRIWGAAAHESLDLLEKGIASVEDIDMGTRLALNWNIGPFEIMDNGGLDTMMRAGKALRELGVDKHINFNSKIVEKMVAAGRLGRKVGKGFYDYTPDGKKTPFDITTLK